MHEKHRLIERAIVSLAVAAVSVDVLTSELPRLMPYIIVLTVIFAVVRLVLFHTRRW